MSSTLRDAGSIVEMKMKISGFGITLPSNNIESLEFCIPQLSLSTQDILLLGIKLVICRHCRHVHSDAFNMPLAAIGYGLLDITRRFTGMCSRA